MIMATDGLWDKLTSDEAVQLVGHLLDGKTGHDEMVLDREAILAYRQQLKTKRLVASSPSSSPSSSKGDQSAPAEKQQQEEEEEELTPANLAPKGSASQVRKFTYRDQANASTHLIRNALGGADDDRLAATLLIPSPQSRQHRDDITGMVFFGLVSFQCGVLCLGGLFIRANVFISLRFVTCLLLPPQKKWDFSDGSVLWPAGYQVGPV
jgi:pyruvate dehydrogenase phosphatase